MVDFPSSSSLQVLLTVNFWGKKISLISQFKTSATVCATCSGTGLRPFSYIEYVDTAIPMRLAISPCVKPLLFLALSSPVIKPLPSVLDYNFTVSKSQDKFSHFEKVYFHFAKYVIAYFHNMRNVVISWT